MKLRVSMLIGMISYLIGGQAQNSHLPIRGTVVDEAQEPVAFANITLLTSDSIFLQGTCSDAKGAFELHPTTPGQYLLQVSYVGYQPLCQPCVAGETGTWVLIPESILLDEAVVTARRPTFLLKGGTLETNVQNSLLSTLNSASDVLKHIPGLHIAEGGYTVFGKGTPLIYLNNRLLHNLTELEQLAAADIEKVELITQPGATYEADVKAVVRIYTLRNKTDDIGMSLRTGMAQGRYASYYQQATLHYQKQKLSLQGMFFHNYNHALRRHQVQYEIPSTVQWCINSRTRIQDKGRFISFKTSIDYELHPHHSLGLAYDFFHTPSFRYNSTSDYTVQADRVPADRTHYVSHVMQQDANHRVNAYYQGKINEWKLEFTADWIDGEDNQHEEAQEDSQTEEEKAISSFSNARKHLYAAKLITSRSLGKGNLLFGADYTFIRRKDDFRNLQSLLPNTQSVIDESKAAGFAEYNHSFGKISAVIGVRFEHAASDYWEKGEYIPGQSRTYTDWLPNLSINFPVKNVQGNLSYTAKSNRPSFFQLRSTMNYNNRFIYEAGNPLLTPETVHDLQLTTLYQWIQFVLHYQYCDNAIMFKAREYAENPDVAIFSVDNYPHMQYLNASIHLSPSLSCWKPALGIYFRQPFFEALHPEGTKPMNHASVYLTCNNTLQLPKEHVFSLDVNYQSSGHFGVMQQQSYWGMDIGWRKTYFDQKLTLNLQASDIWNTRKSSLSLYSPKLTYTRQADTDSRKLSLSVNYRFNATGKAYKGKAVSEKDIQRL